ncbi:class I SAM-dependent DNA methyltransferase [Halobacillus litoralis]|uniref:class I SAM-dependent DNA methyltransferase n=1 Tax=Halobacillus litoralis TaxID=45668 RepID=UPI001CFDD324|nr:class I SAM-dependent methyltransferase [Halobacillus litoralis]
MSYGDMALVYDRLMEDAPYDQWVDFTKRRISEHPKTIHTILDVGCGTGEITHRLHQNGFSMTGVDLSSDMLTIAQQKNPRSSINWLHQNMTELDIVEPFDCVISYCDVFNYLDEEAKVKQAFERIAASLKPGGLFLFDVHSLDHIQNDLIGATFAEVRDDISYVWFCDPGEEENSIVHDLTFFVERDALYQRFDEVHHQRGYPVNDLKNWLKASGFTLEGPYADFIDTVQADGDRLFFVCQKQE